jgi:hypothetical protein
MLESISPSTLEELEQLLKNLNERLKYLEKVVIPSRVTKEELHNEVGTVKLDTLASIGSLRREISLLKEQMATTRDLDQLKKELSKRPKTRRPT